VRLRLTSPTRRSSDRLNFRGTPFMIGCSGLTTSTSNSCKASCDRQPPPTSSLLYSGQSDQLYQVPGWWIIRFISPLLTWLKIRRSEEHTSELQSRENL